MHRPYIIHRSNIITNRTTGDNIATIHQDNGDLIGTRDMYWLDLAPGITDEYTEFHAATTADLEETGTAITPDATPVNPYFPASAPRLYFRTKENAARFAYDYQQSRRTRAAACGA